jgi:DNA-binding transcriptional MerR regulator/methylmalonyl-CoA mutase cobalamin-binding subunit
MYTIKEAAARTGVSVPVLRAWERRYAIVEPARTPSGYRLYDEAALDRLRTMRALVDAGWSPANAARAVQSGDAPSSVPSAAAPVAETETFAGRFAAAAGRFDAPEVEALLDEAFATGTFETVAETRLLPALGALGDAWADGTLDVAAEHAASAAVQRRLAGSFQAAGTARAGDGPGPRPPGPVLVGLPSGARHELGALIFATAARRAGLPVLYLGADLPTADWVATADRTAASAAVVGAVTPADAPAAADVALAMHGGRDHLVVAFGGHGAPAAARQDGRAIVLPDGVVAAVARLREALGSARPR